MNVASLIQFVSSVTKPGSIPPSKSSQPINQKQLANGNVTCTSKGGKIPNGDKFPYWFFL